MAMQSAFVLAALLGPAAAAPGRSPTRAAEAQATLLREYEARWRRRFARRLRVAAAFAHLAMRPAAARRRLAAGARLARPAHARRALERQDALRPRGGAAVAQGGGDASGPLAAFGG